MIQTTNQGFYGDFEDAKKVVSNLIRDIKESLVVINGRLAVISDESWDVNGILISVGYLNYDG